MDLIDDESLRLILRAKADASATVDQFITAVVNDSDSRQALAKCLHVQESRRHHVFSCCCGGILYDPITFTDGFSVCKPCNMKRPAIERVPAQWQSTTVLLSKVVRKYFGKDVQAVELRMEGNKALDDGDCRKAIELYSQALGEDENDPIILANRSRAFATAGCFTEAVKDANQAIQRNPRMAKAHYRKAQALDSMGQLYEASASYLACLVVEKNNAVVRDHLWKILQTVLAVGMDREIPQNVIDQLLTIATLCQQDLSIQDVPKAHPNLPVEVSQEDFHCALCCRLMFQPTTTPCGHTFCASCLNQSLDHHHSCPVCRAPLQDYLATFVGKTQPVTAAVESIIQHYFSDEYELRRTQITTELRRLAGFSAEGKVVDEADIPIFVCTPAFPTVPCQLHIYEPRYRLMIRRCLESGSRKFGMCEPVNNQNSRFADIGTVLIVRNVEYLPDGRSLIDSIGGRRFRVVGRGMTDGYNRANVCFFTDDHETSDQEKQELQVLCNEVYALAQIWFGYLPGLLKDRLTSYYGEMPAYDINSDPQAKVDGPDWVWWVLGALQGQFDVLQVLASSKLRDRLVIVRQVLNEQSSTVQLCRPQ